MYLKQERERKAVKKRNFAYGNRSQIAPTSCRASFWPFSLQFPPKEELTRPAKREGEKERLLTDALESRSSRASSPNCRIIFIPELSTGISARCSSKDIVVNRRMLRGNCSDIYNFPFSSSGSTVELRTAATLLIAILLADTRSK